MKKTTNLSKVLNVSIRGITLISRFFLIFFMAKLLPPSDLGLYGLITAAIGYGLYLVGLDFFTYTTREVAKGDRTTWAGIIKNQIALSLVLYVLFLPTLLLLFTNNILPFYVAKWFFILIIIEHISQEIGRFYIAISEQLLSSIMILIRQGTWAIIVPGLMIIDPDLRNLDTVFLAWTIAGLIAIILGISRLRKLNLTGWHRRVDWSWILAGVKVSIVFLIGSLAYRSIFTIDRFWLQELTNLDVVGAYVLYIGISGTMMTFLEAAVFNFSYPVLISAYQNNQADLYKVKMREMLWHTAIIAVGFSAISLALLPILLEWLSNDVYTTHKYIYPWLLAMMLLYSFGMVPHYALYSQRQDRVIVQSHILGLIVFIAGTWLLTINYESIAVPAGLCLAFFFILVYKLIAYFYLTPPKFRNI